MPHVIERLHQDREKVAKLFEKMLQTADGSRAAREKLCTEIVRELEAHAEFEEQVFYPAIEAAGDEAGEEVEEALDEHQEVKDMLGRLQAMDVEDDGFFELLKEIQESVQAHVQHEENDIFPLAEAQLATDAAQEMAQQHDSMAQEYMQQHAAR
jgi:hemerythrin superfamily protein